MALLNLMFSLFMYFPQEPIEIKEFLRNIDSYSDEQKLWIIENFLKQLKKIPFRSRIVAEKDIDCIINKYKEILLKHQQGEIVSSVKELAGLDEYLKIRLRDIIEELNQRHEHYSMIVSDVKSYKNLYIFILSHPQNNSNEIAEILSRINYLDKMTRDVTFVMPGYKRAEESDNICNASDHNLQLTFDENIFIDIVQDLENKSNGKFVYFDECELLVVGMTANGNYDFDNYTRLNLNEVSSRDHIDAVRLIMTLAQDFKSNLNGCINIKQHINGILKKLKRIHYRPITKVFIAGAKKLNVERALLREQLSKIANTKNMDIRSLTFEDFATSLTGRDKGRQADYNKFIEEEADIVVFIFDSTVGEITEEEFNVAYNSLIKSGSPNIFVYVRKHNRILELIMNRRLRDIKKKLFNYHQEYYVEYNNYDELRYKFYSDILAFIESNIKE